MAIAYTGNIGSNAAAPPSNGSIAITVTINANDTAVLSFENTGGTGSVTSVINGGAWASSSSCSFGGGRTFTEIWTTPASGALAASKVSVIFSGSPAAVAGVITGYTGVGGFGSTKTGGATSANPSLVLGTQDTNNFVVAAFGGNDDSIIPAAGTGSFRSFAGAVGASDSQVAVNDNTNAAIGNVTNTITKGSADWSGVALELRSVAPSLTFYLNNPIQGGSNAGLLDVTAPTASTSTTGWTVGTTAVNQYSRATYNSEVAVTGFTSTVQPSDGPVNLGEDCYRLSGVTTGQFSSGTWYSTVSVIAVSSGGIQQGRARFRIWRSANADGTGGTELTQGVMVGSQVTELNTTTAQSSSASTQIAASNLTNEFLFQQIAWETL